MRFQSIILIFLFLTLSCKDEETIIEGCTSGRAINFDPDAEVEDGSCQFSQAIFYAQFNVVNDERIGSIEISINGSRIGTIDQFYFNGISGCDDRRGTIPYRFQSGSVAWAVEIFDLNGNLILDYRRSTAASPTESCIEINVTTN